VRLFSLDDTREALSMPGVIGALRVLYEELGHERAASGPRTDTLCESPAGGAYALKTMDGVIPKLELGSVRISSDVVNWPTVNGSVRRDKVAAAPGARWTSLVLLFSTVTGEPLAILPDGYVQRMRVGGTSAIALDLMARRNVKTLAVLGSGGQAGSALMGACAVREFAEIRAWSPNRANLERFRDAMRTELGREIALADSAQSLVAGADVVLTATSSTVPVLDAAWVEPGMHLGSVRHAELDAATLARAAHVVIHSQAASPINTVVGAAQLAEGDRGTSWSAYPTLGDLVCGNAATRGNDAEVTCFVNNIGLGTQFTAVGAKLLEVARERDLGREFPTEWFTQNMRS
jgi:ornithine cyclodeaminase/alanine dehydrogenase-like protein (mu-crystallin family)